MFYLYSPTRHAWLENFNSLTGEVAWTTVYDNAMLIMNYHDACQLVSMARLAGQVFVMEQY